MAELTNGRRSWLQRLLRRAGRGGASLPVLEINPRHPLIRGLADRVEARADVAEAAGTLVDLARVQDGDTPRDPVAFARKVAAALAAAPPSTAATMAAIEVSTSG